jgi:hypothetical protein
MDALELLLGRDSALKLTESAPSETALHVMFRSAVRAPDHGRLRTFRHRANRQARGLRGGHGGRNLLSPKSLRIRRNCRITLTYRCQRQTVPQTLRREGYAPW